MNKRDNLKKIIVIRIFRIIFRIFYIFPVSKNKIIFMSYNGSQYSCNPKYISEYLGSINKEIRRIWAFNSPREFHTNSGDNLERVKTETFKFYYHMLTAKTIVVNDHIYSYLPIRSRQILINTWHGGGSYKTVGMTSNSRTKYDEFFFKLHSNMITAFVSSSEYFNETVLQRSFLFKGQIIKSGMPRNSILFDYRPDLIIKVKKHFSIPEGVKIILYAPTYRGNVSDNRFLEKNKMIDINLFLSEIKERFKQEFCLLFRAHHLLKVETLDIPYYDATNYHDMQELLYSADILLTDYSSCMWDFSLMQKPCFIYAPDLEYYIQNRGFFMNIYDWPFPVAKDNEQLVKNISSFDEEDYKLKIEKYHKLLGSYESINSTEKVCNWILKTLKY